MGFWDFLSFLWNSACDFMSLEITIFGEGAIFTLWEFALGSAIFLLVMYVVMRIITGD